MNYVSYTYLFGFLIALFLFYQVMPLNKKKYILLLGSILFYVASSTPSLIIFLLISAFTIYLGALKIDKYNEEFKEKRKTLEKEEKKKFKKLIEDKKKHVQLFVILINVGLIAVLKYGLFLTELINYPLKMFHLSLPMIRFLVPLGISYYTLEAISYIVDVKRGKYRAEKNFIHLFNWLIYFPTIVEGPISKYDQVAQAINEGHPFDYENFARGAQLIMWGVFKKLVVADRANMIVAQVFKDHVHYGWLPSILGLLLYTVQLYADFSGCVDIVCGSSEMFGIQLPQNFNQPFFGRTVSEFWRRWHMTLGAWLKEYVLFSVTLSKRFTDLSKWSKTHLGEKLGRHLPVVISTFCVWMLMGIWHGVGIKYIIYGFYYFIIMLVGLIYKPQFDALTKFCHINPESKIFHAYQIIRTFLLVNFGLLIFRVTSVNKVVEVAFGFLVKGKAYPFKHLFMKSNFNHLEAIILIIGILLIIIVDILHERGFRIRQFINKKPIYVRYMIYFVVIMFIFTFGAFGAGYDSVAFLYGAF